MRMLTSSIGRKIIVAVTGVLLILFVIAHLLGNLQLFRGPEALNHYAELLKSMPLVLWGARTGLLFVFVVHVVFAVQLGLENLQARPEPYQREATVEATLASRTMLVTGLLLLLYVIGHLLHFTLGVILPQHFSLHDAAGRPDVFAMVVRSFRNPVVSTLYIAAMLLLWSHLSHGIASVFQTVGLRGRRSGALIDRLGWIVATVLVLGYLSIPIAVLLGIVGLPEGGAS